MYVTPLHLNKWVSHTYLRRRPWPCAPCNLANLIRPLQRAPLCDTPVTANPHHRVLRRTSSAVDRSRTILAGKFGTTACDTLDLVSRCNKLGRVKLWGAIRTTFMTTLHTICAKWLAAKIAHSTLLWITRESHAHLAMNRAIICTFNGEILPGCTERSHR
jgi:hypothetical protein